MLKALRRILSPAPFASEAQATYVALVERARNPWFYQEQAVPDTIDGRFDVIVLHLFLVIHRLRREESPSVAGFIRSLSEIFFADMDRSLREMGVGDTGVGIRIKKMAQAFYGRLQAYGQGMDDPILLKESLARNLYRVSEEGVSVPGDLTAHLSAVSDYLHRASTYLQKQATDVILKGEIDFLS